MAFVLALGLSGCAGVPWATPEVVVLAKRTDMFTPNCHTFATTGTLVPDGEAGTAIVEDGTTRTLPVRWPEGFSGRRVGTVIEVLDDAGNVIAKTGERYEFVGGYGEDGWRGCHQVIPRP